MSNSSRKFRRNGKYQTSRLNIGQMALTAWRRVGYAVLLFIAALVLAFVIAQPAHAQVNTTNTFNVLSFRQSAATQTVGDMTTAAQAQCNPAVPCVIVFDPLLANFPVGTMPAACAKCAWFDYRTAGAIAFDGGSFFCRNFDSVRCVDAANSAGWSGADVGAWVQSAHADLPASGGTILLGPMVVNDATPATLIKPTCLLGSGITSTVITYTPATGIAFNFTPSGFRACFEHIQLTTSTSTTSVAVQYTTVSEGLIFDNLIHGFFGGIRVTGDGVSQSSAGIRISQILIDNFCGVGSYGVSLDHVGDTFLDTFRIYQTGGGSGICSTSQGLIIDRGAQGIWFRDGTLEGGVHSAVLQNTNLGGAYGILPAAIFATSVTFDFAVGGTNLLLDSSLGTGATRFYCNGCWFAAAGQGATPVTTAMGVDIEGGSDINFIGGVCRFNEGWCAKINSAGTAFEFTEMQVYDNNQGNTAGVGGFLVTANPTNWSIKNLPACGNKGIDTTGHQAYCVDYSASASGSGTAFGNNTTNNTNGPYNIGSAVTTGFSAPFFSTNATFPALSGSIRLDEANASVKSKNHAVSGDVIMVQKDGGDDIVQLGDTAGAKTAGPLGLASTTFASLGTPVNGTVIYCSDCTIANPCASAGTGALAKRINGAWVCN